MLGSVIFFSLCGVIALLFMLSYKLTNDYFTPLSIYGSAWLFLFGAYALGWVDYIDVKTEIWFFVILSLITFSLGALIILLGSLRRQKLPKLPTRPNWALIIDRKRFERWIQILFIGGAIGFYEYVRVINKLFGIATFWQNPSAIRIGQSSPRFFAEFSSSDYLLFHLNMLVVILCIAYIAIYSISLKQWWLVIIGFVSLSSTIAAAARTQFSVVLLWGFFFVYYLRPEQFSGYRVWLRLGTVFAVFFSFFNLIAQQLSKTVSTNILIQRSLNLPAPFLYLADSYIYMTGSIPALQVFIQTTDELAWGKNTFLPIIKILARIFPNIDVPQEVLPFYNIPFAFNVTTYLNTFYNDWGYIGLLVGPFVLGMLAMLLYLAMRRKSSFGLIFANSLMAYCLVYTIFNSRFITVYVWEFALIGWFFIRSVAHSPTPKRRAVTQNQRVLFKKSPSLHIQENRER